MPTLTWSQRRKQRKHSHVLASEAIRRTSGRYRTTQNAIENAIPNPTARETMSWGCAYSFDVERQEFGILEYKGSKLVTPKTPAWYRTVRTDTTDRMDRAQDSRETVNNW